MELKKRVSQMGRGLELLEVKDEIAQENFRRLFDFLKANALLAGQFELLEFSTKGAVTDLKVPHGLGIVPVDVIETSNLGSGLVTYMYNEFARDFIKITTTGPVTVRAFIGRYDRGNRV